RYAEATGVGSLRIRHNNVLGYFVEVSAANAAALRDGEHAGTFIHRQTMASAMRFTSAELAELEQKIASAGERALAIELEIFEELTRQVCAAAEAIRVAAAALAALDLAAALAERAANEGYVRPRVDDSLAFAIEGGRHPVVEAALSRTGQGFVANDCDLGPAEAADKGRVWLLTGPNMAGKSTFLRQNALIAILAQAGSYVPARRAHIGVVEAVFSRVGAADDLARGRSTFMVEMVETAAILNQAGPRALVILDEIGRGTATFDGLSIAWATIEHLHDVNGCRALFATHYHELTALAAKLARLHNATMQVKEWKGDVIFLHEVAPGAADRSYGIQVAKLAGLPAAVTARARQVLERLEAGERGRERAAIIDDLPLFSAARPAPETERHPALVALETIAPDELSPREALERLYELKRLFRESGR
ncbi:MAG TPA: DNA mismatch repair protein MutS, partial [Afifellaceae bacterium]|nr:DNA mismatch repair protein MutS [Afifellaceae bacterium]